MKLHKVIVTGCCGFAASVYCSKTILEDGARVVGVTRNTDQKHLRRLDKIINHPNFKLVCMDINSPNIGELFEDVDCVVNFAAKTFVDYSVRDPRPFIESNIAGVYNLLEAARRSSIKLFVQISTDEVYGACPDNRPPFNEFDALNPTNPYASTKACAEMLCMGYEKTYKIPMLITRAENLYGKYQHPQKVIPTWVKQALLGHPLVIYGDGKQKRMWLRVEDLASALIRLIRNDKTGIYNVAGNQELENIELAKRILKYFNKPLDQIKFIDDTKIRPDHDRRYAIDASKLRYEVVWEPYYNLDGGLREAFKWYEENFEWWTL